MTLSAISHYRGGAVDEIALLAKTLKAIYLKYGIGYRLSRIQTGPNEVVEVATGLGASCRKDILTRNPPSDPILPPARQTAGATWAKACPVHKNGARPMAISLYQASLAPCLQMLDALSAVLSKAASYAAERGIEPSVLLQSRLYPDMLPLVRQVQIATDGAKAGGARLAGVDNPSFPDTEASFDELQARIARCVSFLHSLDRSAIDSASERRIEFSVAKQAMVMMAPEYISGWMLPNFFFHVTTAFDILRHNGLAVGKRDFLGAVPLVT